MFKKLFAVLLVFLPLVTLAAPTTRYEQNISPFLDSAYELGTSTKAWSGGTFDKLCLTADVCLTSWPVSSAYTATYPILLNASVLSLAFGTTSNNIWGGQQTFLASTTLQAFTASNATTTNATTTNLSAGTLCLAGDCRLAWPTFSMSFAYPFKTLSTGEQATSTTLALLNGFVSTASSTLTTFTATNATTSQATTTNLSTGTLCISGDCKIAWPSFSMSFQWPFTRQADSSQATSTTLSFYNGFVSTASSTLTSFSATNGTTTTATSTTLVLTGLATPAGTFVAVNSNGTLIATSTPIGGSAAGSQATTWATTAVLGGTPTYANGASGVGATLTEVGTGALSVDGNAPSSGDRVLVKNQASALQNGIYSVTATGSGIASYVLTRASDYNEPTEIIPGIVTYVISGTANLDSFWAMISSAPISVGVTALNYSEVSAGGAAVTSVTGTSNQITASPTSGAVVLSLPTTVRLAQASSTIFDSGFAFFGKTATSTFNGVGDLFVVGSTTLQNFTSQNATSTNATSTVLNLSTALTVNTNSWLPNAPIQIGCNVNSYCQLGMQNRSNGNQASTDLVAQADNGSDSTHYIDLGINGSTGASAPFTTANHAYLYSIDDTLNIGALGASASLTFNTSGGMTARERARITAAGLFGIGTTSPMALFSITASTTPTDASKQFAFVLGSTTPMASTGAQTSPIILYGIDTSGRVYASSTRPTLTSCGGSPTITGTDTAGRITIGSATGNCLVTFTRTWGNAPYCVVTNDGYVAATPAWISLWASTSATTLGIGGIATGTTQTTVNISGVRLHYYCQGDYE